MKIFKLSLLLLIFLEGLGCQHGSGVRGPVLGDPTALFGDSPDFQSLMSFRRLTHIPAGTSEYEMQRIEYLLERLSKSDDVFIRNSRPYAQLQAMMHLRWKFFRYRSEVDTAESFIERIASGSRKTGEAYYVQTEDGQKHPSTEVFLNELDLLDTGLEVYYKKLSAEMETASESSPEGRK